MDIKNRKNAVNICFFNDIEEKFPLNNILWGLEEEGIPYRLEKIEEKCSMKLSHIASKGSNFGIGIGIGKDFSACIHYEKLDEGKYLFKLDKESNEDKFKALGTNAARLIKRVPFKDI